MRKVLTLMTALAAIALPGAASALDLEEVLKQQHPQYQASADIRTVQSGGKSLDQAISEVRRKTGGKIVGAETKVQGGREVHHIKVLTKDGRVKTHKVNGRRR